VWNCAALASTRLAPVELVATLETDVAALTLARVVADLDLYPQWLEIVGASVRDGGQPGDQGPAWLIDLRAQLGPLRRSKRLRMVRVTPAPEGEHDRYHVRFERQEHDGKSHSSWVLDGEVRAMPEGGANLSMRLAYGGSLWVPMLDGILRGEIERSRPRLVQVARAHQRRE
jgi:hypothetical protein